MEKLNTTDIGKIDADVLERLINQMFENAGLPTDRDWVYFVPASDQPVDGQTSIAVVIRDYPNYYMLKTPAGQYLGLHGVDAYGDACDIIECMNSKRGFVIQDVAEIISSSMRISEIR